MKALAFDIGGTKIFSAIINEQGEIISSIEKYQTPKSLQEIKDLFSSVIRKHEDNVDKIAFSTAGATNKEHTKVISSTGNLVEGYSSIDFSSLSGKKSVYVENDANCAAWAEHIIGVSKGMANSIMITLGTGVGGGIIINNTILKGKSGAAGEMHFKMRTDNHRKCTCGAFDCFESYASGPGLKKTAEEITKNPNVTTYDVIDGIKTNNKEMIESFNKWQYDIINGLIGLSNIFDPDCIVLSGSMAEFTDTNFIEQQINKEIITTPTKVLKAITGNYAGMIGAALLALGEN